MVFVRLSCNRRVEGYFVVCCSIGEAISEGRGKVVAGMRSHAAALRCDCLQRLVSWSDVTRLVSSRHVDLRVGGPQVNGGRVCKAHVKVPQGGRVEAVEGNLALSQLCRNL